jgi:exonuclease III
MTGKNKHLSILILNVNGLNVPIKRHRIANWVKKQDPIICCLQETHLMEKNKTLAYSLRVEKVFRANGPHNRQE